MFRELVAPTDTDTELVTDNDGLVDLVEVSSAVCERVLVALAQCVVEKVTLALVLEAIGSSVACNRCETVRNPLRDEDAVTVWVTETTEEIENQEAVDDFEEVLDGVSVKAPVIERHIVLETHPEGDCETDGDRVALFLGDLEGLSVLDTVTEAVDDAD